MEHEDVHLDGRGDMPPDSITLACNDVQVPIEQVDVDNKSMTGEDEFGQHVELCFADEMSSIILQADQRQQMQAIR
eukprot:3249289-Lingulodinium_polyedra.AAC.1